MRYSKLTECINCMVNRVYGAAELIDTAKADTGSDIFVYRLKDDVKSTLTINIDITIT
ncbi:hypothetical protein D3C87_914780 [compost metagenome]